MQQLIYASRAKQALGTQELASLLEIARKNNVPRELSGMLVYHDQSFLQVLEGPELALRQVFEKIRRDPRHDAVVVLFNLRIQERSFADWSMGFVNGAGGVWEAAPGYQDIFRAGFSAEQFARDGDRARQMLTQFREGRWRKFVKA